MLTSVQIVLLSIIGVCLLFSLMFMIMFIVEICKRQEKVEEDEQEVQSVFTVNNVNVISNDDEEKSEESVGDMLASLEEQTKDEETEEEPAKEEPEVVEEAVEEEVKAENEDEGHDELVSDIREIEEVGHEKITEGSLIDYKARLEKVIELRDKIDRDLTKRQKAILKYERTKRRMNRNQKMLDRKAGELTNLNLVMYSVTDIKNVDEEKKAKQEDLTAHIAELKASIQDADEFIESNKEKNEDNIKMAKYLLNEENRYNEEIAELEALIKSIEGEGTDADKAE